MAVDIKKNKKIHKSERQKLVTACKIYEYYKNMELTKQMISDIKLDVVRADLQNQDWDVDCDAGQNSLYNILAACASYDPVINYS